MVCHGQLMGNMFSHSCWWLVTAPADHQQTVAHQVVGGTHESNIEGLTESSSWIYQDWRILLGCGGFIQQTFVETLHRFTCNSPCTAKQSGPRKSPICRCTSWLYNFATSSFTPSFWRLIAHETQLCKRSGLPAAQPQLALTSCQTMTSRRQQEHDPPKIKNLRIGVW